MEIPKTCAVGRIPDLQKHPNADRIGIKMGAGMWADYRVKLFPSRGALLTCVQMSDKKDPDYGSKWKPLKP